MDFGFAVAFKGTNGTLVINRESWEVYPEKDRMEGFKKDPDTADHQKHTANFVTALKQRDTQLACPIDNGALCAKYAERRLFTTPPFPLAIGMICMALF